jgi:hypothetical protein
MLIVLFLFQSKWVPEKTGEMVVSPHTHGIDISAGVDVALILCIDLVVDDYVRQANAGRL